MRRSRLKKIQSVTVILRSESLFKGEGSHSKLQLNTFMFDIRKFVNDMIDQAVSYNMIGMERCIKLACARGPSYPTSSHFFHFTPLGGCYLRV